MARVTEPMTFDAAKIAARIHATVRVAGLKRWTLRVQVAMWLIQFAGKIAGMKFEIIGPGDDSPE